MPDIEHSNTSEATPRFLRRPRFFFLHYVRRRPFHFAGLFLLVIGAAGCAIGVQVGMKVLVDAMTAPERNRLAFWGPLTLFITLVGIEHGLWRLSGWLGCRTVVGTSVDVRLDLFRHLSGHSMGYFNDRMAGSLGNRITETAAATGDRVQRIRLEYGAALHRFPWRHDRTGNGSRRHGDASMHLCRDRRRRPDSARPARPTHTPSLC